MPATQPFDANASAFNNYLSSPWGRLLHNVTRANVDRHLERRPLRILDAGGGNGVDAIPFAAQGHEVTVLDSSAELLNEARYHAQEEGVAGWMEFYEAELTTIPAIFPDAKFDVILCHNVLQYVEDLGAALGAICNPLLPGELLSVICINRYSEPYREALQQLQPGKAYAKLNDSTIFSQIFKLDVKAYTADDLRQALQEVGCAQLAQYGIRCVSDYIPNNDLMNDAAFFAELEQLEYAMSARYPYYLLARFFQIIAEKVKPL